MSFLERLRGIAIGVLSVLASAAAIYVCLQQRVLWVLVPIPGLMGLMYHLLNLQPRYQNRMSIAERYRTFVAAFQDQWGRSGQKTDVGEDSGEDLTAHEPKFSSTLWAAAVLTSVLSFPAAISHGGFDLIDAAGSHPMSEAATGLVFAGLGVYALIILRMIGRINSGGMHARFMLTAALRSTIAQVLGFFAGAAGFFAAVPMGGKTAYFLIGLFYPLFVEQLRDKAIELFSTKKPVTEPMELQMVNGIDDDVADILTELGISDVQHLASSDPAVLTVRSLYPFERSVDWINQAMLIERFGDNIAKLRALNVNGIVDWIPLMQPIVENTMNRPDADAFLQQIATATGEPVAVLRMFGRARYGDYKVNLLWRLCQHRMELQAIETPAIAQPGSPRLQIAASSSPQPAQVTAVIEQVVKAELQRRASDDAAKFKAENPDATVPADADIQAIYQAAYDAALQRATLGASPKPGAGTRTLYEQTFRDALQQKAEEPNA